MLKNALSGLQRSCTEYDSQEEAKNIFREEAITHNVQYFICALERVASLAQCSDFVLPVSLFPLTYMSLSKNQQHNQSSNKAYAPLLSLNWGFLPPIIIEEGSFLRFKKLKEMHFDTQRAWTSHLDHCSGLSSRVSFFPLMHIVIPALKIPASGPSLNNVEQNTLDCIMLNAKIYASILLCAHNTDLKSSLENLSNTITRPWPMYHGFEQYQSVRVFFGSRKTFYEFSLRGLLWRFIPQNPQSSWAARV